MLIFSKGLVSLGNSFSIAGLINGLRGDADGLFLTLFLQT